MPLSSHRPCSLRPGDGKRWTEARRIQQAQVVKKYYEYATAPEELLRLTCFHFWLIMGKSPTIQDQAEKNKEFQDYIDGQSKALQAMVTSAMNDTASTIQKYYSDSKIDDATSLISGQYYHLSTITEWSLDNVSKIIDAVQSSVFGKTPAPTGSTANTQSSEVSTNLAKMADMTTLVTTAAFNCIQGILVTLNNTTSTSLTKQSDVKEIIPGLTLFITIIENTYSSSSFLNNESISQTGYVYDCRFSTKQAGAIASFQQVQALISEEAASQVQITKVNTAIEALDPVADDSYDTKLARFQKLLDGFNDAVAKTQAKIKLLQG
jgi:hypothetical protein